jgi:hypothetical protein
MQAKARRIPPSWLLPPVGNKLVADWRLRCGNGNPRPRADSSLERRSQLADPPDRILRKRARETAIKPEEVPESFGR